VAKTALEYTKPAITADYMCPPFKTLRQLGNRAIASDTFDLAPGTAGGQFGGEGLGKYHHREGYNVTYGDGSARWYEDADLSIAYFDDWADTNNPGTDNLTISSPSSQRIWNRFDRVVGIDAE
jgi:hypothetical protein